MLRYTSNMGQEISVSRFDRAQFEEFARRLHAETALLEKWIAAGCLASPQPHVGLELEAWLVGPDGRPAPRNREFLAALGDPLVVPELATFNFELNTLPVRVGAGMLAELHAGLRMRWARCRAAAQRLGLHALTVGILPTVRQVDLCLANMTPLHRYRALNEQVFRLRDGRPIQLDIDGAEHLWIEHQDLMLEAAATSLQLHVQIDATRAVRAYNAAKMLSAPMVAVTANSPLLFGRRLWQETRIPLFEQAVAVGGTDDTKRVTFGIRYAEHSILECFTANRDRYPVLLPELQDVAPEQLAHLRLHNGTIWRWNRPLIGFDATGQPHVRIEHRVIAAGPSSSDQAADAALFFGLLRTLLDAPADLEQRLPFAHARANFYAAARMGLAAEVSWLDGARGTLAGLFHTHLIEQAHAGLIALGVDEAEAQYYLGIVAARVASQRTGAWWQRAWLDRYGNDPAGLVAAYCAAQAEDKPVHLWEL